MPKGAARISYPARSYPAWLRVGLIGGFTALLFATLAIIRPAVVEEALAKEALAPKALAQQGQEQPDWQMTPDQERNLYTSLYGHRTTSGSAPVNVEIEPGSTLPSTIAIYDAPASVKEAVPPIARYRYVTIANQLVFVEPSTRRVVCVIGPGK